MLRARSQEQHDVRVPNDFHDGAFVLELFELVLLDDLALNFLDGDGGVLPFTAVDDTIAAFTELAVVRQLLERNFVILPEDPIFLHHEHVGVLGSADGREEPLFDVFAVGAGVT